MSKLLAGSRYTAGRYRVAADRTLNRPYRSFTAALARAPVVAAAVAMFTVRGRLEWRGYGRLRRDARRKIHKITVGRVEEWSQEPGLR